MQLIDMIFLLADYVLLSACVLARIDAIVLLGAQDTSVSVCIPHSSTKYAHTATDEKKI